jgi:hypothetical protein
VAPTEIAPPGVAGADERLKFVVAGQARGEQLRRQLVHVHPPPGRLGGQSVSEIFWNVHGCRHTCG